MRNQPAVFSFVERNARRTPRNCAREEGMGGERQPSAPRFLELATACVSSPGGGFPQKKGGYPGPAPRQLWVSNTEQFVQPLRRCSVFAPCPVQQSPARAKGCWASREGKGCMARLRRFPRAAPDAPQAEGGTGVPRGTLSLRTLGFYLVLDPACSAMSQIPLKGENKRAGSPAPLWLEDAREED